MKRLWLGLCLFLTLPVFAQGGVQITADTASDVLYMDAFGPGYAAGVAFSGSGKLIAVASSVGVKLYETGAFGADDLLDGDGFSANSLAFAPDGISLIAVNNGYNIRTFDVDSGEMLSSIYPPDLTDSINFVAYSPDGTSYALNAGPILTVVDAATGETRYDAPGHVSRITSIAYSPDGARIATASFDLTVNLWDAASGEQQVTLSGHTDSILGAEFSADGSQIITVSIDGTARAWDAVTGTETAVLAQAEGGFGAVAVAPDGTIALGAVDGSVRLITPDGEMALGSHPEPIRDLAFSPDSLMLVSLSEGSVLLWDLPNQSQVGRVRFEPSFTVMALNPDGTKLAAGGIDGTTYIFDPITGETVLEAQVGQTAVSGLVFDLLSDTLYIANADDDNRITEIDALTGEIIGDLETTAPVVAMARHPAIAMINGVMADGALRWWGTDTGEIFGTSTPHAGQPTATAYSPDGAWMASGDSTGQVFIWGVENGEFLFTLDDARAQVNGMAFTSDGTILAAALADGQIMLWRLAEPLDPFLTIGNFFGEVTAVAFSPDNSVLAATSLDGTLRLLDAQTGAELNTLYDQSVSVLDLAFSPDGTRLYSVGGRGAVVVHGIFQ